MPMESIRSYQTFFLIQYAEIDDRIKIGENGPIFKFLSFKNSVESF